MNNIFINYSLFILFLPLVAFVVLIFTGKRLPRQKGQRLDGPYF